MKDLKSFLKNGSLNLSKMQFIEEDFEQDTPVESEALDAEEGNVTTAEAEIAIYTADSETDDVDEEMEWADDLSWQPQDEPSWGENEVSGENIDEFASWNTESLAQDSVEMELIEQEAMEQEPVQNEVPVAMPVATSTVIPVTTTDFTPAATTVTTPVMTPAASSATTPVALPTPHTINSVPAAAQPLQFQFDEQHLDAAKIKVIGIGGGGGNAVNYMIEKGLDSVEYIALNTDAQALKNNKASIKIQVGSSLTGGLGAGARPEVGREAIEENRHEIEEAIEGADMVFITAGMGGGTGTGGAPIVANIAKRKGILTVGIVTTPFDFEGRIRMQYATEGILEMRAHCDTLIVIPNERLWELSEEVTSMVDSFAQANDVLYNATRGISDLILLPGLINLDFADVRTTMTAGGAAIMGSASATGAERAEIAAHEAINSPLLDGVSIRGARNVLVNISSSKSLRMQEFALANSIIKNEAGDDAEIIMGTVLDESFGDELRITVIATGFEFQEGSFQVQSKTAGASSLTGTKSSFNRTGYTTPAQSAPAPVTPTPSPATMPPAASTFVNPAVSATHTNPMQMERRLEKDSTDFYRGEQNLKILDAPAIHRRTLRHSAAQTQADEDIRPVSTPNSDPTNPNAFTSTSASTSSNYPNWQPKQKIDKSDSEQPAFLRRIMD